MWYANLGSVEQTRYELGQYHFPDRLVEYSRRDCAISSTYCALSKANGWFDKALELDPGSVTANQRLAEIALAAGNFDSARAHLEPALRRDPANKVTWQLIGDAYLGLGRLDDAFAYWSRIADAPGKLSVEASVRYDIKNNKERAGWVTSLVERIQAAQPKPQ